MWASSSSATALARIGAPLRVAPSPCTRLEQLLGGRDCRRSPGPGRSPATKATQMVNSATPSAKERVPSIGSTTQTRRRSAARGRPRSPPTASRRPRRAHSSALRKRSTAMSASVTSWPGPFSQLSCGWRKWRMAIRPASSTAARAWATSRSATALTCRPPSGRRSGRSARRCCRGSRGPRRA